ncbi:MAG: AI-2E family transporter [Bacteroidota bacterium]|jgi:predicted PurR-regulated permease PerM
MKYTDISHKGNISINIILILSALAGSTFLYLTDLIKSPVLLFLIGVFLLYPFRKESYIISRFLSLISLLFALWLLIDLNIVLLPFIIAFTIAFLSDPIIKKMESFKIKRWLGSIIILGFIGGAIAGFSVFVFPLAFTQLNQIIKQVSQFVNSITDFLESKQFYTFLSSLGIPKASVKELVQTQLMPKAEILFKSILEGLFVLLSNVSAIANQILNLVLIPIISFYIIKDYPVLKELIQEILSSNHSKSYENILRISAILRLYVGWQMLAALWIGTVASILLSILGIPYAIVLGVLCGLLNPIPFFGTIASMIIGSIVALLADPLNASSHIIGLISVINGLHFINAYIIEPRVLGTRVGLHPVLLLGSLFVFGHFLGFIGFLIAVPTTAILMMFFRDWKKSLNKKIYSEPEIQKPSTQ